MVFCEGVWFYWWLFVWDVWFCYLVDIYGEILLFVVIVCVVGWIFLVFGNCWVVNDLGRDCGIV